MLEQATNSGYEGKYQVLLSGSGEHSREINTNRRTNKSSNKIGSYSRRIMGGGRRWVPGNGGGNTASQTREEEMVQELILQWQKGAH
jgi:hypothetical protein